MNNPFAVQNDDDYRGGLYITTILCFIFVVITCIARGHVRYKAPGADDTVIGIACIVGFVEYAIILAGAARGLGSRRLEGSHAAQSGQVRRRYQETLQG